MEQFSKRTPLCSVALDVEGQKLWVCPQRLAFQCEVFNQMFFESGTRLGPSIAEVGKAKCDPPVYPILNTTVDALVPFLRFLTDSRCMGVDDLQTGSATILTKANCFGVIELAERFQVWSLKRVAERFLEEDLATSQYSDENLLELLAMCDMFNLKASLKSAAVGKIIFCNEKGNLRCGIDLVRAFNNRLQTETLKRVLRRKLGWRFQYFHYPQPHVAMDTLELKKESLKTLSFLEEMNMTEWPANLLRPLMFDASFICQLSPCKTTIQGKDGNGFILHDGSDGDVKSETTIRDPRTIAKILLQTIPRILDPVRVVNILDSVNRFRPKEKELFKKIFDVAANMLTVDFIKLQKGKLRSKVIVDLVAAKYDIVRHNVEVLAREKRYLENQLTDSLKEVKKFKKDQAERSRQE